MTTKLNYRNRPLTCAKKQVSSKSGHRVNFQVANALGALRIGCLLFAYHIFMVGALELRWLFYELKFFCRFIPFITTVHNRLIFVSEPFLYICLKDIIYSTRI